MDDIPRHHALIVVHQLAAPDFTLGSPDFATPALAQTHALAAADYSLQPLDFGYSEPSQTHRLEPRRQRTGRPPAIPTDAVREGLIGQMEDWLRREQAKTCRRLGPKHPAVRAYAEGLAQGAGVDVSYHVLTKQVLGPNWPRPYQSRRARRRP